MHNIDYKWLEYTRQKTLSAYIRFDFLYYMRSNIIYILRLRFQRPIKIMQIEKFSFFHLLDLILIIEL